MKKLLIAASAIFLLSAFACKKEKNEKVTVVRDCTGSYLRLGEKDYHVCNPEKIGDIQSGTEVTATFKKTEQCNSPENDRVVCMMYHQNEGWIEIQELKQ